MVSNPRFKVSLCRFRLSLRLFVPLSGLWFVVVSFRLFSVPFRHVIIVSSFVVSSLRYVVSSLRMNRADLGTILTTLNMAAMKRSITSGELKARKAFIRSNIQQILNEVNNNLREEKDGINYYFVLR